MPYINVTAVRTITNIRAKAKINAARVITSLSHISQDPVTIMGLVIHPESARHTEKNAFIVIRRDTSPNFVIPNNVANLQDPEIHQTTIDILVMMCRKLIKHNLMTLFSLSKIQLRNRLLLLTPCDMMNELLL